MDEVFAILALVAVVLGLFIGAVLGWVADSRSRRLRREVEALTQRVAMLEAGAPASGAVETAAPPGATPDEAPAPEPAPDMTADAGVAPSATVDGTPAASPAGPVDAPDLPEAAPQEPVAAAARGDLEQALGGRWAVWVGGLALALGGVFLVRYSIEAGLLGPGARIAAGLAFSVLLLALGDWMRRRDRGRDLGAVRSAYIPGVLTAAGTVSAFATIFAAYAIYGFLGDTAAFLALGVVALATMALALLHGPGLAGLGLAASYVTPFLVSSSQPSFTGLSIYLLAVTAATLALARIRGWRWLAITGAAGAVLWATFMGALASPDQADGLVIALFTALAFALVHAAFVGTVHVADPGLVIRRRDGVATAAIAAFALPVLFHVGFFGTGFGSLALMVGFGAATMATAYAVSPLRLAALAAVGVVLVGYTAFGIPLRAVLDPVTGEWRPADMAELLQLAEGWRLVGSGLLLGLYFAALGLLGAAGSASRVPMAVAGATIPAGLLVLCYLKVAGFEVSVSFGFAALALAAFLALTADRLIRRLPPGEWGADGAVAAYAVTAVGVIAAGLGMMFERGVLTVALAAVVPAIAMVEVRRPLPGLRPVAAAVAAVVALRFVADPAVVGDDLGRTPVFNWLLWGHGGPALLFALAAWRFGKTRDDRFVPVFEALAVVFTTLTAVMLIHHGMNGGDLRADVSGIAEQGLLVASLLAVAVGMQWIAVRRPSTVFSRGTLVVGTIGFVLAAIGLLVVSNPAFTDEPIDGGAFDGALILGYLLPAVLALAVARIAARRPDRPVRYVGAAAALAGALVFAHATLAVRAAWSGPFLGWDPIFGPSIPEGELYSYTAVWLAFAVALLAVGAVMRSRPVRVAAAALTLVVVAKVFLVDTAGLEGALRAASFIGLGAVLVLVGLAYQRFLRRAA